MTEAEAMLWNEQFTIITDKVCRNELVLVLDSVLHRIKVCQQLDDSQHDIDSYIRGSVQCCNHALRVRLSIESLRDGIIRAWRHDYDTRQQPITEIAQNVADSFWVN